jgi:hypothetical protein
MYRAVRSKAVSVLLVRIFLLQLLDFWIAHRDVFPEKWKSGRYLSQLQRYMTPDSSRSGILLGYPRYTGTSEGVVGMFSFFLGGPKTTTKESKHHRQEESSANAGELPAITEDKAAEEAEAT